MKVVLDGMLLSQMFSGVEVSILNLARSLAEHGTVDCAFYVPARFPAAMRDSPRFHTVRTRVPAHLRPIRILWEQVLLPAALNRGNFDLVHAPGYIVPLLSRVPVVTTIYDLIALMLPRMCKPSNRLHFRLMLPRSIARSDGIIVPSERTRGDLLSLFPLAKDKVRVIPLAAGSDFRPVRDAGQFDALRQRLGLPETFILFVGRIEPKKNLLGLLNAYHRLRAAGTVRHGLVLAGPQGWGGAPVHGAVSRFGLRDEVVFTGPLPTPDIACLYNMADIFVFPSHYEGFGLPLLEAMSCGTAVVASNRGSIPEVVGDAALLADPDDPASLAGAIASLLADARLREDLSRRGLKRAALFSWSDTARKTEQFYADIVLRRAGAPVNRT